MELKSQTHVAQFKLKPKGLHETFVVRIGSREYEEVVLPTHRLNYHEFYAY